MAEVPSGWYDDPSGRHQHRYWTEATSTHASATVGSPAPIRCRATRRLAFVRTVYGATVKRIGKRSMERMFVV